MSRGSLTFWFSDEVMSRWQQSANAGAHGNQKYSDRVILCGLTLRQLFRLTLRATEGMLTSLVQLAKLAVELPDYSTFSRN